ncbi:hypothetical protein STEG23_032099, partial [Scotinomys teguina]
MDRCSISSLYPGCSLQRKSYSLLELVRLRLIAEFSSSIKYPPNPTDTHLSPYVTGAASDFNVLLIKFYHPYISTYKNSHTSLIVQRGEMEESSPGGKRSDINGHFMGLHFRKAETWHYTKHHVHSAKKIQMSEENMTHGSRKWCDKESHTILKNAQTLKRRYRSLQHQCPFTTQIMSVSGAGIAMRDKIDKVFVMHKLALKDAQAFILETCTIPHDLPFHVVGSSQEP